MLDHPTDCPDLPYSQLTLRLPKRAKIKVLKERGREGGRASRDTVLKRGDAL